MVIKKCPYCRKQILVLIEDRLLEGITVELKKLEKKEEKRR